ncbi:hypothetical protein BGW80DRAFT_1254310 [Lactifluus volemus]|nr:hypothetical protein BGW80DRAFT_1254310 [Lactifluus volemus]
MPVDDSNAWSAHARLGSTHGGHAYGTQDEILAAALHIAQSLDQFERRIVTRIEEANPEQDDKGGRNFQGNPKDTPFPLGAGKASMSRSCSLTTSPSCCGRSLLVKVTCKVAILGVKKPAGVSTGTVVMQGMVISKSSKRWRLIASRGWGNSGCLLTKAARRSVPPVSDKPRMACQRVTVGDGESSAWKHFAVKVEPKDTGSARYHDDQLAGQGSKGFGAQALHVLHRIERSPRSSMGFTATRRRCCVPSPMIRHEETQRTSLPCQPWTLLRIRVGSQPKCKIETPSAILDVLNSQYNTQQSIRSQSDSGTSKKWLNNTVTVLCTSSALGQGIGMTSLTFELLKTYVQVRLTEATKGLIVEIMAEILEIPAISTKVIRQGWRRNFTLLMHLANALIFLKAIRVPPLRQKVLDQGAQKQDIISTQCFDGLMSAAFHALLSVLSKLPQVPG